MPSSYTLGSHYEDFVQSQLESGEYSSASEVVRAGLRLLKERNDRLRSLDQALLQGLKDADTNRVRPAPKVFAELEARYAGTVTKRRR